MNNQDSVVIPSKSIANLQACIQAIREADEWCRIIVVDDGIKYGDPHGPLCADELQIQKGISPFVFARNVNIGITAAGSDDVIVMNDDALLQSHNGFKRLAEAHYFCPEFGVIAPACNNVGNRNQNPQGKGMRIENRMVCFICVYIPRTTIEKVGLLDEQFVHYGCEDDDYCLRVRRAGMKIGIYDFVFVDHATLKSEYRGHGSGDYRPNLEIFKAKWGAGNHAL